MLRYHGPGPAAHISAAPTHRSREYMCLQTSFTKTPSPTHRVPLSYPMFWGGVGGKTPSRGLITLLTPKDYCIDLGISRSLGKTPTEV